MAELHGSNDARKTLKCRRVHSCIVYPVGNMWSNTMDNNLMITPRAPSEWKDDLFRCDNSNIKIRLSWYRLIFIMGIHMLVRQHLYIETDPVYVHTPQIDYYHKRQMTALTLTCLPYHPSHAALWNHSILPSCSLTPTLSLVKSKRQLSHWGRDKMAAIFQKTFSNAFSWMKMFKFRLRFHWSLFPRVQLTIFQHWFR